MRVDCDRSASDGLCYPGMDYVTNYLNQDAVKSAVGARSNIRFQSCNTDINRAFSNNGDYMQPTFVQDIKDLLNKDTAVLIYAGNKDFICNWLGNEAWSKNLDWKGKQQFNTAPQKEFITSKKAGQVRNYKHFTFAALHESGHMAPHDQPENSLEMANRWIRGRYDLQ